MLFIFCFSEAVAFEKDEEIMALKRKLEESQEHVTRSGNLAKDMDRLTMFYIYLGIRTMLLHVYIYCIKNVQTQTPKLLEMFVA